MVGIESLSAWAVIKCYKARKGVVLSTNMMCTNMVNGDLHCMYAIDLFRASGFYCVVETV